LDLRITFSLFAKRVIVGHTLLLNFDMHCCVMIVLDNIYLLYPKKNIYLLLDFVFSEVRMIDSN